MQGNKGDLKKLVSFTWRLWSQQNQRIYEEKAITLLESFERAISVMFNYKTSISQGKTRPKKLKSEPPPTGFLKLNVDDAICFDLQKTGIEFVVRDHKGKAILTASILESKVANPKTIEALAILRSLQLCMHQGIANLIIESDCMLIVDQRTTTGNSSSTLSNILLDMKELMSCF